MSVSTLPPATRHAPRTGIVLARAQLDHSLSRHLPEDVAREEQAVPTARAAASIEVACLAPSSVLARRLARAASCPVRLLLSPDPLDIAFGLESVYGPPGRAAAIREEAIAWNLVRLSYVDAGALRALLARRNAEMSFCDQLLDEGLVGEESIAEAVALTLHLPYIRLGAWALRAPLVRLIPRGLAEGYDLAPIGLYHGRLLVALARPDGLPALREAARATGLTVAPVVAPRSAVRSALRVGWGTAPEGTEEARQLQSVARAPATATRRARLRSTLAMPWAGKAPAERHETDLRADPEVTRRLPATLTTRLGGLPLREQAGHIVVASVQPLARSILGLYEVLLGRPILNIQVQAATQAVLAERWFTLPPDVPAILWPEQWWTAEETFDEFLVSLGYVTGSQASAVRRDQETRRVSLRALLLESGILTEEALAEALGLWLGVPWMHVDQWIPDPNVPQLVPPDFARQHGVLCLAYSGSSILIAIGTPGGRVAADELAAMVGLSVRVVVAERSPLVRALRRWFEDPGQELSDEFVRVAAALVRDERLTPAERTYLAENHVRSGEPPDRTAARLDLLSEEEFSRATAGALGLSYVDFVGQERFVPGVDALGRSVTVRRFEDPIDPATARRLTEQQARSHAVIPVRREPGQIVIAFAWPSREIIAAVESAVGTKVAPVVARRSQIEAAIARWLGRPRLGDSLLKAGLVQPEQLEAAVALAGRAGLRLGEALVSLGHITEIQLAVHLAEQHGLPVFDLQGQPVDPEAAQLVPRRFAAEHQVLPVARVGDELLVAIVDPLDREALSDVERVTGLTVQPVLVTASEFAATYQDLYHEEHARQSASDLMTRAPEDSASQVLSDTQKGVFLGLLVVVVVLLAWQPMPFLIGVVALVNLFYLTISLYRFYLIFSALGNSLEIAITADDVASLDERSLPVYTILVPLYRETEVLPTLVDAIGRLDYPKAKLDVKLLLEEDDVETIRVARESRLPPHFQLVIIPNVPPKGKPKACNYGLLHARGTYVVIYDAEDAPEADQLKKVVVAFRKGGSRLACVQCKLNYYNQDQNVLTRWFTSEYSMWFDLFLPGLNAARAPIPLGGTSNHFPTIVLQDLGAWDPYNVTEDADLGIRLFKRGYTTAVVDSTTFEEANSDTYNWIRQRSRWVKGYIQTWLVHMRNPIALYRALGFRAFFSVQMTVGGTFFTFLVNPVFWALTAVWFLVHWGAMRELFPGPIYYVGSVALIVGNFSFTYASMLGCLHRGYYSLVKYNVFVVLYWYLMSIAAWKGFLQLFSKPWYWEKTVHGLYRGPVAQSGVTAVPEMADGS